MKKVPFDIKYRPQIESGEYKVETVSGFHVEILRWDRKHPDYGKGELSFPIVAIVDFNGLEQPMIYRYDGIHPNSYDTDNADLVIITND